MRGWLLIGLTAVSSMSGQVGAQRFLDFSQVEPNQSVGKQHCGNSAGSAKSMDGCFAHLEHFSQLAGGQIVSALVFWLFLPIRLPRFRVFLLAISWQLFLHRFK